MNLLHPVQYLALVWAMEHRGLMSRLRNSGLRFARALLLAAFLGVLLAYGAFAQLIDPGIESLCAAPRCSAPTLITEHCASALARQCARSRPMRSHAAALPRISRLDLWMGLSASVPLAASAIATGARLGWAEAWLQEDGWIEWATVYFALLAAAAFLHRAWRALRDGRRGLCVAAVAAAAFCVVFAGEELSWCQRLIAATPPELFLAHNFQQELNVHNLLQSPSSPVRVESRYLVAGLAGVWSVGILVLAFALRRRRAVPQLPFLGAVVFLALAYPFTFAGEVAELLIAVNLSWAALRLATAGGERVGVRTAALIAAAFGLGWLSPILVETAISPLQQQRASLAHRELQTLSSTLQGAVRGKLLEKRSIHKRLFTAYLAGYFEENHQPWTTDGARSGYFVDPWGSAYWVWFDAASQTVTVYSFGPNGRRDSRFGGAGAGAGGDDLLVTFTLPPR